MKMRASLLFSLYLFAAPALMVAQTDEIQVYDGEIAPPGIFNLMVHHNFTPHGSTVPDHPDAIIANHSYQVTAELAYGVTPRFEQGLYMPVERSRPDSVTVVLQLLHHRETEKRLLGGMDENVNADSRTEEFLLMLGHNVNLPLSRAMSIDLVSKFDIS